MARTAIVAGYLVGNPVGGHVLSILHWLAGLRSLGYDVIFAEHHGWPDACWNPRTKTLSDDPVYGIEELAGHAERLGLRGWCFVDAEGAYHGLGQTEMLKACSERRCADRTVDRYVARGVHGVPPSNLHRHRPGIHPVRHVSRCECQPRVRIACRFSRALQLRHAHRTAGLPHSHARHRLEAARPPVALDLLPLQFTPAAECFTTVMAWSPRKPIVYDGVEYGLEGRRVLAHRGRCRRVWVPAWRLRSAEAHHTRRFARPGGASPMPRRSPRRLGPIATTSRSRAASSASPVDVLVRHARASACACSASARASARVALEVAGLEQRDGSRNPSASCDAGCRASRRPARRCAGSGRSSSALAERASPV